MDDQQLTWYAIAAKQGDREAAAAFVRGTQRQVRQLLRHLTDRHHADDLTQDCYVRAFSSLASFRGQASARSWLLAIARRVAADHLRRRRRRPQQADCVDWQSAAERVQPLQPAMSESYALRVALGELDADRREAFVLTQVLGLSYEETARVCGCRIGTVRSRVARARSDLAEHLRDDAPAPRADPGG
ncbi:RNA polymerase sigma-70 factor (ECF subfamily) [Halopolyspora algeriensis]|uniref:RNA polymerase sigma-70 factor (ECF subfamily) n=1 Tax=Halopolyspora algeriensis TaxID=1500506 RepID=A0A368VQ07_9ACTN|nr:sigma-70 family RNA polymerase sigma factor [Halopolyspora algeriensis]RCW43630.1 RNA polymerase sigma-70 factor (ECF subfamily) [Halopolyspora algeriensis]TQM47587.1 RNA polymerase sigma-70 factor (ECF subfamily) [Halopolyspora algeriensis]